MSAVHNQTRRFAVVSSETLIQDTKQHRIQVSKDLPELAHHFEHSLRGVIIEDDACGFGYDVKMFTLICYISDS